jgi:hypothetical protein
MGNIDGEAIRKVKAVPKRMTASGNRFADGASAQSETDGAFHAQRRREDGRSSILSIDQEAFVHIRVCWR